jgi:hypothetical protein
VSGTVKRNLKNKMRMDTQIKFYKNMVVCVGLYGSENWVLTEKDKNRIQAAVMRFFIPMSAVTRQDRLTDEVITKILKVNCLDDTISKYRDNWFNHLTRMDPSRFPRYMLFWKENSRQTKEKMDESYLRSGNGRKSPLHKVE